MSNPFRLFFAILAALVWVSILTLIFAFQTLLLVLLNNKGRIPIELGSYSKEVIKTFYVAITGRSPN